MWTKKPWKSIHGVGFFVYGKPKLKDFDDWLWRWKRNELKSFFAIICNEQKAIGQSTLGSSWSGRQGNGDYFFAPLLLAYWRGETP
jgi:hypothetical protein